MLSDLAMVVGVLLIAWLMYSALCDFVDWGFDVLDPKDGDR